MREYDLQEMKVDELEEVNGGTSQVDNSTRTGLLDSVISIFNNIKDFFTR